MFLIPAHLIYTFRISSDELLKQKHGRSAVGAERNLLTVSTIDNPRRVTLYIYTHTCFAQSSYKDADFLEKILCGLHPIFVDDHKTVLIPV